MIIKIIPTKNQSSSKNFSGVNYNDNKVEKGTGELMKMENFPSHINSSSSQKEVVNYFKAISKNDQVAKPQFHCVISTDKRSHSKTELAEIADRVMKRMGYEEQPYIIVFHNDTDNNHVHIVSSRVDKNSGKKINDSYEKLKSQTALREVLKELYGVDHEKKVEKLLGYKFSNESQFIKLMQNYGFDVRKGEKDYTITHNGVPLKKVNADKLNFTKEVDESRKKQLYSVLNKYKDIYSNEVFKVVDDRTGNVYHTSELQHELKERFGVEIVFSNKDNKDPFGYTIIDNKSNAVFKGSDVMKMGNLFKFTSDTIDKTLFDILNNYNISDKEKKQVVKTYLQKKYDCKIKDSMVFKKNKKVPYELFEKAKNTAVNHIRNHEHTNEENNPVTIVEHESKFFMIDNSEHKIYDLEKLVGEYYYNMFVSQQSEKRDSDDLQSNKEQDSILRTENENPQELLNLSSAFDLFAGSADNDEEQENKRKKRKR